MLAAHNTTPPPHPNIDRILISEDQIRERIKELGRQISKDYTQSPPILIGILKGSLFFLSDLMRVMDADCCVDFMSLTSYSGTKSTGAVRLVLDLRENVQGRDLLIIEDIIDTGLTLNYLEDTLRARNPRSLAVCALLDKPDCRKAPVVAKYVGFTIPNEFVVGYGLDLDEKYRNLPYIGVLKK